MRGKEGREGGRGRVCQGRRKEGGKEGGRKVRKERIEEGINDIKRREGARERAIFTKLLLYAKERMKGGREAGGKGRRGEGEGEGREWKEKEREGEEKEKGRGGEGKGRRRKGKEEGKEKGGKGRSRR